MIEMATARPPWPESETQMGVLWQIASSSRGPTPPETLSEVGRDMLFQCFKRHPNERITAHQMLAHEYLRHEQVPLDDDALQHTTAELERRASQAYESGDEDGASSTPVLSSGQATGHARNGSATLDLPEIAAEVEESEQKDAETIEKQREWLSELQEDVKREREKQQQNAPGPVTSEVAARLQEVAAHAPIK
jgi:serine/threonine protein kinase